MANGAQVLVSELVEMLNHHRLWWTVNFWGTQIMFLLAIIASVGSTFLAARAHNNVGQVYRRWVASIAAIPAFVLTMDSTFDVSARAAYHDQYIVEIERMLRSIRVEKKDPVTISNQLSEFQAKMLASYPDIKTMSLSPTVAPTRTPDEASDK